MTNNLLINEIEDRILLIRSQKVMIDRDLAELYGVKTMVLNQAVKRNIDRFPVEFMFKLNESELSELITNCDRLKILKHTPSTPYAFTEYGVAMLSSVLNSKLAISVNIEIIKTFIKLKNYALTHSSQNKEIKELRTMLMLHIDNIDNRLNEHGDTIDLIIRALNDLVEKPKDLKQIGFNVEK